VKRLRGFQKLSAVNAILAAGLFAQYLPVNAQALDTATSVPNTTEARIPPRAQPFKTAPQSLVDQTQPRVSTLPSLVELDAAPTVETYIPNPRNISDIDDAPWVLEPDQKPWPLHYLEPSLPTRLVISPPTVNELRLFLPGEVSDFIDRTRYAVNRYITDSIGAATQIRRRQLDHVQSWGKKALEQQQTLPNADWPRYQFSKELRAVVAEYRAQIEAQSPAAVERFVAEAKDLISRLTELMPVMPMHDMRKATYDLMVRMQEGAEMFQAQISQDDGLILRALEEVLRKVPEQDIPDTRPPSQESSPRGGGWHMNHNQSPSTPARAINIAPVYETSVEPDSRGTRSPASSQNYRVRESGSQRGSPNSLKVEETSGSSWLGYFILIVAGFGVFSLISRKRNKKRA